MIISLAIKKLSLKKVFFTIIIFSSDDSILNIIMEYADGGDLQKLIKTHLTNQTYFQEKEIWKIIVHITLGLKTLHD